MMASLDTIHAIEDGQALPSGGEMTPAAIGPYTVIGKLGEGGFGVVFEARDPDRGVRVAVKVLATDWATDVEVVRRFRREGELLGSVRSDHVVGLVATGDHDGRPFIVMEFAGGRTLADRLADLEQAPSAVVNTICSQLAKGVGALHERSIVHRDIAPGNILYGTYGDGNERILLADLGLALSPDSTRSSHVAGTLGYGAPEIETSTQPVTGAADIYSCSKILETLLDSGAACDEPASAARLRSIVDRGTREDPRRRYRSIQQWQRAVERAVVSATARRSRRRVIGAAIGVAVLAAVIGALTLARRSDAVGRPIGGDELGSSVLGPVRVPRSEAALVNPVSIVGANGERFVIEAQGHRIWHEDGDELVAVVGTGKPGYAGDGGPAPASRIRAPYAAALATDGSLYFTQPLDHVVRRVDPDGIITTVAGVGRSGRGAPRNPAAQMALSSPAGIVVGHDGTIHIADSGNGRIVSFDPDGLADETAVLEDDLPLGLALDPNSDALYYTAFDTDRIGIIDDDGARHVIDLEAPSGVDFYREKLYAVARSGAVLVEVDIARTESATSEIVVSATGQFSSVSNVDSELFVTDWYSSRIARLDNGHLEPYLGVGEQGVVGDRSSAAEATLLAPTDVLAASGRIFVLEAGTGAIRYVDEKGLLASIDPRAVAATPRHELAGLDGALVVAGEGTIHLIEPETGVPKALVGSDEILEATGIEPGAVFGLASGSNGTIYATDRINHRVLRVRGGVVEVIAGVGRAGDSGDGGPAATALLNMPGRLAANADGTLFVIDNGNARLRRITRDGIIDAIDLILSDGSRALRPADVAVDHGNSIAVLDAATNQVLISRNGGTWQVLVSSGTYGRVGGIDFADTGELVLVYSDTGSVVAIDSVGAATVIVGGTTP